MRQRIRELGVIGLKIISGEVYCQGKKMRKSRRMLLTVISVLVAFIEKPSL